MARISSRFVKSGPQAVRVLAAVLGFAAGLVPAAAEVAAEPDAKAITAYAERALASWQVPGMAIAVVKDGKTVFADGVGLRELGRPERMDADTVFNIASVSKAFAAMAAAVAVDRGQIAWDQPVIGVLPEFRLRDPYVTAEATFRDLFAHRVGIAGEYANGLALSREEMVGLLRHVRPIAAFRTDRVYSNLLYGAAGLAVANAVGMSWDAHIREVIFGPLGMSSSSTTALDLAEAPNRASSHLRGRDGVLRVDPFRPRGWWSMDNHAAAGAVNSTARDMAKWLEFQLGDGSFRGGRMLSEQGFAETHSDQVIDHWGRREPSPWGGFKDFTQQAYTLGWQSHDYHKERILSHGGLFRGHQCVVLLHPDGHFGVFVFVNARDRGLDFGIAQWILDRHLGLPEKDWAGFQKQWYDGYRRSDAENERRLLQRPEPPRPSPVSAGALAGTYRARDGWEHYEITLVDGKPRLALQQMSEPYFAELEHWNGATFKPSWNETVTEYEPADLVNFTLDAQGEVRSMVFFHAWTDAQEEFLRTD